MRRFIKYSDLLLSTGDGEACTGSPFVELLADSTEPAVSVSDGDVGDGVFKIPQFITEFGLLYLVDEASILDLLPCVEVEAGDSLKGVSVLKGKLDDGEVFVADVMIDEANSCNGDTVALVDSKSCLLSDVLDSSKGFGGEDRTEEPSARI